MADKTGATGGPLSSLGSALKDSPAANRLADETKSYLQAKGNVLIGGLGDKIESATEQLNQAWQAASEDLYKAQQEQQAAGAEGPQPDGASEAETSAGDEGDVKDVDYEVVDDDENKK
jgi:hypothetical protein